MRKKYCIFACGGRGTRMGADIPKQFIRLGTKTILQLSIEKILSAVDGINPVVVLPQEYRQWWRDECTQKKFFVPQMVISGGITRFHSVKAALQTIPSDAVVAVHDGVRPFVSRELVSSLFEAISPKVKAVVPVIAVTDTLKVLDSALKPIAGAVADRSVLYGAQTPQVFDAEILKAAYELPFDTAFTDDASIVSAFGESVTYIPGERYNIKITTPEDLSLARILLGV